MPTYAYVVRDATGQSMQGTSEAENQDILRRRLTEQGFTVSEVKQIRSKAKSPGGGIGRIKLSDLAIFCRQFSTMIDAGVTLVRCLEVLGDQTVNPKLRRIVADIQSEVEAGQTLSRALQKYPNVFNSLFVGLVRAGEVGGVLEESLQRLSQFLEKDQQLRRKVKSAMTYPIIIAVIAVSIVLLLVTLILPKFMVLFNDLGVKEFPLPTQILVTFSNFVLDRWYFMLIFVVGFFIAFRTNVTNFGIRSNLKESINHTQTGT